MRPLQKPETFPDGIVEVYAEAGRKLGELKIRLRYERQSVGVFRFYQSAESVAGNRIDRMIKVPHTATVNRLDVAVMATEDKRQYRIQRIQEKPERGVDLWELESIQVALKAGVTNGGAQSQN